MQTFFYGVYVDVSTSEQKHFRGGRARIFPDLPWGAPPSWGQPTYGLTHWEILTGVFLLCVKRDLLQCQKTPTTVSKETYCY
jgi:hypothetical protein